MSAGEIVAVIFIVVFVIGVIVGVITVTALAAVRTSRLLTGPPHRREDDDHDADELNEREHGYGIPGHWDGVSSDPGPGPRWPGGEEP
jgi:hypothetical protein